MLPVEIAALIASLSPVEREVYVRMAEAAIAGAPAPTTEELCELTGLSSMSSVPQILSRLEKRGLIRRQVYQRGRIVTITSTGLSTARPADTSPHWRDRSPAPHWRDRPPVPSPSIHSVRSKAPSVARQIEQAARHEGRALPDFLGDLVYMGFAQFRAEQEAAE